MNITFINITFYLTNIYISNCKTSTITTKSGTSQSTHATFEHFVELVTKPRYQLQVHIKTVRVS